MEYTPEQKEVIKSLKKFLFHSRDREILLNAPGGTGKTAIISGIFEGIPGVRAVFTAPTHQALSVLSGSLGGCRYSVMTIHKFLRLTLDEGKLIQKRRGEEEEDTDFLVVDECSMVGQDLLYFINRFLEGHPECKVVYLGGYWTTSSGWRTNIRNFQEEDRNPDFDQKYAFRQRIGDEIS